MAQDYLQKRVSGIKDSGKRKSAYYKLQREQAEEGGDQDTTDKIYKKLGKASHNVDSDRGNKAILGAAPFLPEAIEGLGARAAVGAGRMALGAGRRALAGAGKKEGGELAEAGVQRLRTPTPVKRPPGNNTSTLARKTSGKNSSNPNMNMKDSARTTASAKARTNKWTSEARAGYAKDAAETAARRAVNTRPKELTSGQKSLGSSGQWHYEKELGKQAGRKLPKEPKTFNRNGTKRAEGRQKSDRNPVSARAKPKSTAKSKHMDEWSQ
jgi:hypothetical protein